MPHEDLSGHQLDAINLNDTDLTAADLRQSSLRHAHLRRATLASADLTESDLKGADLREADLTAATLRRTNLTDADLRAAGLEGAGVVEDVILTDARGVPAGLADRVQDTPQQQEASPRQEGSDAARPASALAQIEQERQLATGEENPG